MAGRAAAGGDPAMRWRCGSTCAYLNGFGRAIAVIPAEEGAQPWLRPMDVRSVFGWARRP
jgi:hypothetical protein